jgi:hypothetical protein
MTPRNAPTAARFESGSALSSSHAGPDSAGRAVRLRSYDVRAVTLCTLCRRNLLAGESFRYWRNARQRAHASAVCSLCEAEATREGWLRAERAPGNENAVGLRGTVRLVA